MEPNHVDVLIVGAGISGIGAGYHLQERCPGKSYLILEGREELGGTWSLFRYPGLRSDSDMYTLGYSFRPWTNPKAIADGPSILSYLRETAEAYGIDAKIRYGHRVERASWSSDAALWAVEVRRKGSDDPVQFTSRFLFVCAGYYDYEKGYTPEFPGIESYAGEVVHPQQWSDTVEYADKRVVVIGSGATAMTLVPELAKKAHHVTMLQRSPTYVVSAPAEDPIANWLRARLPANWAYQITRWKNVGLGLFFYRFCRRFPERARRFLLRRVRAELGPGYDVDTHFAPPYDPWDQRVCLVPDGDLFRSIESGDVSVVTDQIDTFTEGGIQLASGERLEADLVVTATGLQLKFLGGVEVEVDGETVEPSSTMAYRGMMLSDVPNLAIAIGYTNASWTLKVDLTCEYLCRLINYMDDHGYRQCCPRRNDPSVQEEPLIDFTSGYVRRSIERFPRGGSESPWRLYQNYALDTMSLRYAPIDDGVLELSPVRPSGAPGHGVADPAVRET